jgi:hypothetical protein
MEDRRWSMGIHEAIEMKENVEIRGGTTTKTSITYQNFFTLYPKLAGMTGTGKTTEKEFVLDSEYKQLICSQSYLGKRGYTIPKSVLKKEDIVIYESTVYPGCTEEDCVPVLQKYSQLNQEAKLF